MTLPTLRTRSSVGAALLGILLGISTSCQDQQPLGPLSGARTASIQLAATTPANVTLLVVTVSGYGIDSILAFQLAPANGAVIGTLTVPVGQRRFQCVAYDLAGVPTHSGDTTITVQPGSNTNLTMPLRPLQGDQAITIAFGTVRLAIVLDSAATWIRVGHSAVVRAELQTVSGQSVGAVRPRWASSNPFVAPIDTITGIVRASHQGLASIGATFNGLSAVRDFRVAAASGGWITLGSSHACQLNDVGAAWCWGLNNNGQLGDGTTTQRTSPVAVGGGLTFSALAAGTDHTCGLTATGAAYCWGFNWDGRLGDGTTTQRTNPVAVGGGLNFSALSAGANHTCGLTATGAAYCWGFNGYSKLGDGTTTDRTSPVAVGGGLTFAVLAAGYYHTCGITTAGAAYCWGFNYFGQLGDGTTTDRTSPVAVGGSLTFAVLAAGFYHTCGITTAGAAYCWGDNTYGQLGDGTTTHRTSPVAVGGNLTFTALAAGSSSLHTCGLTTNDNAVCWGSNSDWQLGSLAFSGSPASPVPVDGGLRFSALAAGYGSTCGTDSSNQAYCWGANYSGQLGIGDDFLGVYALAAPVSTGQAFALLGSGESANHVCALSAAGDAYCWGYNADGELGDATTAWRAVPTRVSGSASYVALTAGERHTCGLTTAGTASCWGYNAFGQLGDGTTVSSRTSPVAVGGGLTFTALTAGQYHSCGLTAAGAASCWGNNSRGQLGDGTIVTSRTSPVAVVGGLTFAALAAGQMHSCGLTAAGAASCWGNNSSGQLGDGTIATSRTSPVAVGGGLAFTALAAGTDHTCGLTATGAAYCWGRNVFGQLGDGTTAQRTSPVAVGGGLTFTALTAGQYHTCGLTTAGTAYCWGRNLYGQLGDGTTTPRTSPQVVGGGLSFTQLQAGSYFVCGLLAGGGVQCWGINSYGQLGRGTFGTFPYPVRVGVRPAGFAAGTGHTPPARSDALPDLRMLPPAGYEGDPRSGPGVRRQH